jgi:hypothetical protein
MDVWWIQKSFQVARYVSSYANYFTSSKSLRRLNPCVTLSEYELIAYLQMLLLYLFIYRSWDGLIGIVIRLWVVRPRNQGSILGRVKRFFSTASRPGLGPTKPPIAVVLKLWGATPWGGREGLQRGAQHTFLQTKIKTALDQLEK